MKVNGALRDLLSSLGIHSESEACTEHNTPTAPSDLTAQHRHPSGIQGGNLTAGRIDLICRVISSSLFFSGGVRSDSEVCVVMGGSFRGGAQEAAKAGQNVKISAKNDNIERSVTVTGSQCTHLRPDERTISINLQCSVWIANGMMRKARGKAALRRVLCYLHVHDRHCHVDAFILGAAMF